jgi:hypothetical protein
VTIIITLGMAGCMRWDVVATDPRLFVETEQPSVVRLILADNSTHEIRQPLVAGDSIASREPCERSITADGRLQCRPGTGAVSVDQIESLEVRTVDAGSSVTGGVVVFGALLLALSSVSIF